MTQMVPEQKRVINHRARTHGASDPQGDLGVSGPGRDRERWTSNEPEPPHDGGLVVIVWLLASLIAEVEVRWWVLRACLSTDLQPPGKSSDGECV
jgi:hypothetical protein